MASITACITSIRTPSADSISPPLRPHSSAPALGSALSSSLANPRTALQFNQGHFYTYICTLCHTEFHPPSYTLSLPPLHPDSSNDEGGGDGRIFCQQCYIWIVSVGTCWRCKEMVTRSQKCVVLGWCFWHWGCFACLICQVGCSWGSPVTAPSKAQLEAAAAVVLK